MRLLRFSLFIDFKNCTDALSVKVQDIHKTKIYETKIYLFALQSLKIQNHREEHVH